MTSSDNTGTAQPPPWLAPTWRVEGDEATRYREAAALLGLELNAPAFDVDRAGQCPELAAALVAKPPAIPSGASVWLITGPGQGRVRHGSERFSFEEALLDRLFLHCAPFVEAITRREAILAILTVRPSPPASVEELSAVESARLELRSTSGILARFGSLAELDRGLNQPENYLSRTYLQKMVDSVVELSGVFGDISEMAPPDLLWEAGSYAAPALGGLYLFQGESRTLLVHPPPYHKPDLEETYKGLATPMKLSSPGLAQELQQMGLLEFDLQLLPRRLEEIEDENLLGAGLDPLTLGAADRGPALASRRATFPRVWRELSALQPLLRRREPLSEERLSQLSSEARVKLAVPVRDVPVVSRLLSELDHLDYPRFHAYNRLRFARHFEGFSELKKAHVLERIRRASLPGAPVPSATAGPRPEADPEGITFIDS